VLVVGNLPALLGLLLLGGLGTEAPRGHALGEELAPRADVREALVGVPDLAKMEGGEAKGDHDAVEQDHDGDVTRDTAHSCGSMAHAIENNEMSHVFLCPPSIC
jgi:hypothetical protein